MGKLEKNHVMFWACDDARKGARNAYKMTREDMECARRFTHEPLPQVIQEPWTGGKNILVIADPLTSPPSVRLRDAYNILNREYDASYTQLCRENGIDTTDDPNLKLLPYTALPAAMDAEKAREILSRRAEDRLKFADATFRGDLRAVLEARRELLKPGKPVDWEKVSATLKIEGVILGGVSLSDVGVKKIGAREVQEMIRTIGMAMPSTVLSAGAELAASAVGLFREDQKIKEGLEEAGPRMLFSLLPVVGGKIRMGTELVKVTLRQKAVKFFCDLRGKQFVIGPKPAFLSAVFERNWRGAGSAIGSKALDTLAALGFLGTREGGRYASTQLTVEDKRNDRQDAADKRFEPWIKSKVKPDGTAEISLAEIAHTLGAGDLDEISPRFAFCSSAVDQSLLLGAVTRNEHPSTGAPLFDKKSFNEGKIRFLDASGAAIPLGIFTRNDTGPDGKPVKTAFASALPFLRMRGKNARYTKELSDIETALVGEITAAYQDIRMSYLPKPLITLQKGDVLPQEPNIVEAKALAAAKIKELFAKEIEIPGKYKGSFGGFAAEMLRKTSLDALTMTYGVANARHTGSPIDVALAYYTDSLKLGIDMFFARREEEIRQEKNNEQKKKPVTAGEIVEVLNHGIKKNLKKAEVGTVTITAEGFVRELAKKVEQHYRLSADTDVMHRGRKVTVETMLRDFSLAAFHQMDDGVFTLVKEGADYKRLVSDFENGLDYSHLKTETCSTSRAYVAYAIRTPGLGKPVFRPEDIVMLDHDAGPEKLAELHKANKVVVVNGSIVPNPSKPREAGIMLDYVPDPHVLEVPRKLPAFILPPLLNGVTQRNSEHGIVAPLVAAAAKPKAAGTHHIRKG